MYVFYIYFLGGSLHIQIVYINMEHEGAGKHPADDPERFQFPREFALKRGINYVYLNQVLNGRIRVNDEFVERLSAALGVPPYQFFSDVPLVPRPDADREPVIVEHFPDAETRDEFHSLQRQDDFVAIRILADSASMGEGRIISREDARGYALIYRHALPGKAYNQPRHDPKVICVFASGNSMSPTIQDGSLVAIDVEDRAEIQKGRIYAVEIPDEGVTLKRVYHAGDHLALLPDNPETPGFPRCVPIGDLNPVRGRVVWAWNVFR